MKKKIPFFIFFIFFINCKSQIVSYYTNKITNNKMEKLDINKIKKIVSANETNSRNIVNNNIKSSLMSDGSIIYIENKTDGSSLRISGDDYKGYYKKEMLKNSNIEKQSEFFSNGNLKKKGDYYKEIEGVDPSGFSRAIVQPHLNLTPYQKPKL